MKKKLNTTEIINELQGSVFFPTTSKEPAKQEEVPSSVSRQPEPHVSEHPSNKALDSRHTSYQASLHASTLALSIIEEVRKTVKGVGREVVYVRLTPEEKSQLSDVAYSFKRQGMKTSENEIVRIGVNFLLADFQANGENSVLSKILEALNA